MHTAPSFSMPNPGPAPHTPVYNGRRYTNPNDNYEAPYITVAYTDPILLPNSSAGFLLSFVYHNAMWHNTLGQPDVGCFSHETPPQFLFWLLPIDMTPAQATAEPDMDSKNITNQLAMILREFFGIEPKGERCI
jgi:hypothetical protein